MEHSDRGKYVTDQVVLWIENDSKFISDARKAAGHVDMLREYLTSVIRYAPDHSAPWHVRQELAENDYNRVDWEDVARRIAE